MSEADAFVRQPIRDMVRLCTQAPLRGQGRAAQGQIQVDTKEEQACV